MADQNLLCLSTYQNEYLDAWSTVYIEAGIQLTLGISLSLFLSAPGRYLFFAWLLSPSNSAPHDWLSPPGPMDKKHLH